MARAGAGRSTDASVWVTPTERPEHAGAGQCAHRVCRQVSVILPRSPSKGKIVGAIPDRILLGSCGCANGCHYNPDTHEMSRSAL